MRLSDWDVRLAQWANAALGRPFEWGVTDCHLLVAEALDVMHGSALVEQYRGAWHDEQSAAAYAAAAGVDIEKSLRAMGAASVPASFRQRGDIVLLDSGRAWPMSWVCVGERCIGVAIEDAVRSVRTGAVFSSAANARVLRVP